MDSVLKFDTISLDDIDLMMLLDRIDTKYITDKTMLPLLLERISKYYYILEINNRRQFEYNTLYFDTEKDSMYLAHHNGRINRYKVRQREYVGSNLFFLEIKVKTKLNRTIKYRTQIEKMETDLSEQSMNYIHRYTPYKEQVFTPKIFTGFNRITLVNKSLAERVTIDTDIYFRQNGDRFQMGNLVVIEQKRDARATHSSLVKTLVNDFRIFPQGLSKYCLGRAYLEENLKANNFKPRILTINKIRNGIFAHNNFR